MILKVMPKSANVLDVDELDCDKVNAVTEDTGAMVVVETELLGEMPDKLPEELLDDPLDGLRGEMRDRVDDNVDDDEELVVGLKLEDLEVLTSELKLNETKLLSGDCEVEAGMLCVLDEWFANGPKLEKVLITDICEPIAL